MVLCRRIKKTHMVGQMAIQRFQKLQHGTSRYCYFITQQLWNVFHPFTSESAERRSFLWGNEIVMKQWGVLSILHFTSFGWRYGDYYKTFMYAQFLHSNSHIMWSFGWSCCEHTALSCVFNCLSDRLVFFLLVEH